MAEKPLISERAAWTGVRAFALTIISTAGAKSVDGKRAQSIVTTADAMLAQLAKGIHRNPSLVVYGLNPKGRAAGTMSRKVYAIEYKHVADGKDYRHDFEGPAEMIKLKDGAIVIRSASGKRLWDEFEV